ncbi:MAG TPA: PQQ-binding-like beta-propeller repeat protein, partial [Candidatus Binatia bacterium]|nr:PQQ-binding-like beta-propeller repeat protein [Candidatus Binatia bacterium]
LNSTTLGFGGHGLTTYDWNISLPIVNTMPPPYPTINTVTGQLTPPAPGANPVAIIAGRAGDMLLCRNGSLPSGFSGAPAGSSAGLGYPQLPYTYFAINLNASKGAIGSILWMKTYDPPSGNVTQFQSAVDFDYNVFVLQNWEPIGYSGYSLDDGSLLWTVGPQNDWNYYFDPGQPTLGTAAYGNFYNAGFGGIVYCYDIKTGQPKWTYGNGGAGNSTNGGLQIFYGTYPTELQAIANGVVYIASDEHTIPNPIYKGSFLRAINATDGTELWQLSLYPSEWTFSAGLQMAVADGYLTAMNGLDNNVYSVGRGPSAINVEAQPFDTSIVIRGTVTDTSPGTKQAAQVADFPNGVPVASDTSMKDWMGYVYQQKPLPTNFTGVDVTINVLDSNNNFRSIGTATTDTAGMFSLTWKPDIPGDFKVFASFAGSNGYWPSSSETTFTVSPAHPTTAPTAAPPASMTDTYVLATGIAVIVVLIIIGAAIMLMLRKRP